MNFRARASDNFTTSDCCREARQPVPIPARSLRSLMRQCLSNRRSPMRQFRRDSMTNRRNTFRLASIRRQATRLRVWSVTRPRWETDHRGRRTFVLAVACAAVLLCGPIGRPAARGQQPGTRPLGVETRGRDLMTPQTQQAIERGLAYLAHRQKADGSIGSGRVYERDVAVTGLAGMAFLSGGHTPGRGKYGREVEKCVEFILSRCQPNGYIYDAESHSHGPMYGHGFATLFLAEAYGVSRNKDLRPKLEKAIKLIVSTQNKDGGWRYFPEPKDADLSVTVCQIMALRAARNAGIYVPKNTIDQCTDYVKRCQNPDGGFRYQLRQPGSEFPRSAAGVVALYSVGIYEGREIDDGIDYVMRHIPGRDVFRHPMYYYYGHYYAVQAMWQKGDADWEAWYPAIRDELLDPQRSLPDGGWRDPTVCNEYGTAMALLILQMPNNYLPIFER